MCLGMSSTLGTIKSKISYNEFLNIKNYKLFNENKNNIYELYGVLCHIGNIDCGHYYTYCKDEKNFYLFNDENVSIKCHNFDFERIVL